jgi:hypothetical protein
MHNSHTGRMVKSLFGVARKNQLLLLKIKVLKLEAKSFATLANSSYTVRKEPKLILRVRKQLGT